MNGRELGLPSPQSLAAARQLAGEMLPFLIYLCCFAFSTVSLATVSSTIAIVMAVHGHNRPDGVTGYACQMFGVRGSDIHTVIVTR